MLGRSTAILLCFSILAGCGGGGSATTPQIVVKNEGPALPGGPDRFEDVTAKTGIKFTYRNGEDGEHFAIIESLGGGVALFDYDGDGRLDILCTGGGYYEGKKVLGHPCRLFRNLGDWEFQDVSERVGLTGSAQYSHGASVGDYNCDGWPDLLVTGYNRVVLFENSPDPKGGRLFKDVSAKAKLTDSLWSSTSAWGDLDGDGFPELYVSHYGDWGFETNHPTNCTYDGKTRDVCQPRRFKPLPHQLWKNNGDGTFTDITEKVGLRKDGKGMQVLMLDVNGDGRPEIYAANDTDDNFLYLNEGKKGEIVLKEIGLRAGVARDEHGTPNGSMGLDAADYDRSGKPSIIVTNYENELPALYQNLSAGARVRFDYGTPASGIGVIGGNYVGWGTGFFDFDLDGWEDLVMVNGHAIRFPAAKYGRRQKPVLMHNRKGQFKAITPEGGEYFRTEHNARGAAIGDLDNDGKLDLVVSHLNEPLVVLRNVSSERNNWVGVQLAGAKHRDLVGTKLVLENADGIQTRFIKGGASFGSSFDKRIVFGIGSQAKPGRLTVHWPTGAVQEWDALEAGAYWTIEEGKKNAEKATAPR